MSALDQAFIKAFSKEATVRQRTPSRAERAHAPPQSAGEPAIFDELYDAGTFYRVDVAAERAVPAAHTQPEHKVPRRLQRRAHRPELADAAAPVAQPESPSHALPPRRHWSRSMLEIARQLARLDSQHALTSELAPEIIFTEPPLPEQADEPVAPAEQNVIEAIDLPASPPQAIAELWPLQSAIVSQPTLVSFADAESWLAAPIAPAVICHERLADEAVSPDAAAAPAARESSAASRYANLEAAFKATITPEVAEPPAKSKRQLRIDGSHARPPAPHMKPKVDVQDLPTETAAPENRPAAAPAAPVEEPHAPALETPVAAVKETPAATVPKRPYIPLWEVDHFTWPVLCDKLMHDPNGYFAGASNKLLSVVRGGLKVLGITGSRRGEGRTTLALCLARAAAQAGIHVALVDADFARPQLASMLGLETAYGWQEAAIGKIPLSEAAVKSLADRLTVLPLEVSTSTSKLSLADPRVTATLRATAATFDLVIVDLGPLGSSSEPLFPPGESCPLDAAVVVRDTRYALVNESRTVGDRLYDAGIEAVGIAENFVTQPELAFL